MNHKTCLGMVLVCAGSLAATGPKGTAPRPAPDHYPAHAQRDGIGIGAKLLTRDETRDKFASDVNRCCLIVELAVYPEKDKPLNVSLNDLSLLVEGMETPIKPSSSKVIAAAIQKDAKSQRDVTVYPTVGVGYGSGSGSRSGSGSDPYSGVHTEVGVGVAVGASGSHTGSSPRDRDTMETELTEKGLPEGAASVPVAGYVYFPYQPRKKNSKLQLQYNLNANQVVIKFPTL